MAPLTWDQLKASMTGSMDATVFDAAVVYLKSTAIDLENANSAVGLQNADIDEFENFGAQPPPLKAMVRKLIRVANAAPGAGGVPTPQTVSGAGLGQGGQQAPFPPVPIQPVMPPLMSELIGSSTASAGAVAMALRASTTMVCPTEMLLRDLTRPLEKMAVENQAEMSLFQ